MSPTWQVVALAAVNMLQIVLLAWINMTTRNTAQKVNGHLADHMRNG